MKIHSPAKGYTATDVYGTTSLHFEDGVATFEGDLPPGIRQYLAGAGYELVADEDAEPFDPSKRSVNDVRAHLETASPEEAERVLEAERNGKARSSLIGSAPVEPEPQGEPVEENEGGDDQ